MEDFLNRCRECQARWDDGKTCEDDFHQMLFWETETPSLWVVHHLMVLCYYLQHPSLYSADGLNNAKTLLIDFVVHGLSPQTVHRQTRGQVDSGKRQWKVSARPDSHSVYAYPVTWTMTARDVVAGGMDHYIENVQAWAKSMLVALQASNNIVTTV
ncbi:MAG: DUF5946 family protein [Chloroflexota bacterium]